MNETRLECEYYLGLDIGTDSVGYAVTGKDMRLLKFKGEPMWGSTTFEAASPAAERRAYRTARRRLDRRQQRVQLVREIFAPAIARVDPDFYKRMDASRLFRDEAGYAHSLFPDAGYTDKDYHKAYPTIHHLIADLMNDGSPHDVRLVCLACIWLVAHRGHFLFDVDGGTAAELLDFRRTYASLREWMKQNGYVLPWNDDVQADVVSDILSQRAGVGRKEDRFKKEVFGGKLPARNNTDDAPCNAYFMLRLLCGGKVKLVELFGADSGELDGSVSLCDDEETFAASLEALDENSAELLMQLRRLTDCALLSSAQNGMPTISEAKVGVYEQHRRDLAFLKSFVRKYCPGKFNEVFCDVGKGSYAAYAAHEKTGKEELSDYLRKLFAKLPVEEADMPAYEDMMERLEKSVASFLPRQKDTDNRVIPQQLYRSELERILDNAAGYLPFLDEHDAEGFTAKEKLIAVFCFRVPYYVGPLNRGSSKSWFERRAAGPIRPWDFEEKVDLDGSEENFIRRMTNTCTYLAGEPVLPKNSLLYSEFMVRNEIAPLKVGGMDVSAKDKQRIYDELFLAKPKVRVSDIRNWLTSHGYGDDMTGIDLTIKSSCRPHIAFRRLIASGVFTSADAEKVIERMAFTEDKGRLVRWLRREYPALAEEDVRYLSKLGYKDFGRFSARFLCGIEGQDKSTGEVFTLMEAMRSTGLNLNALLSSRFTFAEAVKEHCAEYYAERPLKLDALMDDMRLSGAVKRSVYRTMDIVSDVAKAMGHSPSKVFIEMARGASPDQKGKRTASRYQQLRDIYASIKEGEDVKRLLEQLNSLGDGGDSRLQSDKLYLYYLQMGRCLYTGEPIDLASLFDSNRYNIDHIWPQAYVKDDSIINNKVLVTSKINGEKDDVYPIKQTIRYNMAGLWRYLHDINLISEEKYKRLTRATPFTEDEKYGFINRQLVETRQSTKAVGVILARRFGDLTEIIPVKAGLVSDFRHEFDMVKCRSVNDLHHAKDAYLNIVCGNVWNMRFSRRWFSVSGSYSLKTKTVFESPVLCGGETVWRGAEDLALVRKTMAKNAVHLTRFSFCRKGGLFDQMPVKAAEGLVPLKAGLDTGKYGGYNKAAVSYYLLASYSMGKKKDVMFVPVELRDRETIRDDPSQYCARMISAICAGKKVCDVNVLLGGRKIKINTVISLDGLLMTLSGKDSGGARIILKCLSPLLVAHQWESYIKHIEHFFQKTKDNAAITLDFAHDGISRDENCALYAILQKKIATEIFSSCPGGISENLAKGERKFSDAAPQEQARLLLDVVAWLGGSSTCDLTLIGGAAKSGSKKQSAKLSNWKEKYSDVRLVDMSASGMFETTSGNLLELL